MDLATRGQVKEALAQAERLTEQVPKDPAAWRALGHVQVESKAFKDAEQSLLRAIALAPKDGLSWEHLGRLYRRSGDFARAVGALRQSLAINDGAVRPRLMLANSLADLGKTREAIAEYRRVLALDPDHFRAHNNLANLLAEKRNLKEAAYHYARAVDLSEELTYRISAAHAARRICDWPAAEKLEESFLQTLRRGDRSRDRSQPFPLLAMPAATAVDQLAAGRQMAQAFAGGEVVPHKSPAALAAGS